MSYVRDYRVIIVLYTLHKHKLYLCSVLRRDKHININTNYIYVCNDMFVSSYYVCILLFTMTNKEIKTVLLHILMRYLSECCIYYIKHSWK